MRIYELQRSGQAAQRSLQALRTQMTALEESLRRTQGTPQELRTAAKSISDELERLQKDLVPVFDQSGGAGPALPGAPRPLLRDVGQMFNSLDSYTAPPNTEQAARIDSLAKEVGSLIDKLNKIIEESIPNLNKQIRDSGISFINPGQKVGQ